MKTLKSILAIILALTLLCGCVPAESGMPEEENADLNDVEADDVLPDIDDDLNDEIVPIVEPDIEDDGGVVLDEPVEYSSQTVESENEEFKLTLFNAKDHYTSDENIEIEAMISLISGEKLTVWSGDPILTFSLEGDTCFNDYQGSGMTMDILMPTTFTNIEDMIVPYQKSGGWSASDPYNAFYTDFFNDRDSFKLPAGNYTVVAYLDYSLDENDVIGTRRSLGATVSFTVSGKTLADLGYYPEEAEEQPSDEIIVEEDVVVEVPEIGEMFDVEPLVNVTYPEMSPYPDESNVTDWDEHSKLYQAWRDSRDIQQSFEGRGLGVDSFVKTSVKEILTSSDSKNLVYSPINVYMALGMLAELADGETREQILDLMGEASIDDVRASAKGVWNNNYCDDGALTSVMAGSVWADEAISLKHDTAKSLAENYYAEIYSSDIGSPEMIEAYKAWLNKNTGGLLKDAIENTEMSPEAILALATTVYFRAKWDAEFNEAANTTETFATPEGDIECKFMHQSDTGAYYYSEDFSAISRRFNDGCAMWLVLPDENVSVNELLNGDSVFDLIINDGGSCESTFIRINQSIPKFDVSSDIDLKQSLLNLGVTDVFNREKADFSNLTDSVDGGIWLDKVKHVARVKIDEEGCEAAAYTEMVLCGDAMPPKEEVDFVLNRPFVFAITGITGDILFVGVVNNPVA